MNYLLTYNPDSKEWPSERESRLRKEIDESRNGKSIRWNCVQGTKIGDRGFMLRQGDSAINGIFGLARAVEAPREIEGRYYAQWEVVRMVNPEESGPIIPTVDLQSRFPQVHWGPRQSGTSIPDDVADKLEREILAERK